MVELKSSTLENPKVNIINLKTINKDIFVTLIKENKISLYRLSKSIVKNEADVEDAISETILKAYKNIHRLKEVDSFKPWIMKILINECYNIIKKQKKFKLQENFENFQGTYDDVHEDNLIYYINKLEDNFKAVVILFYYEDLSIKSISKVINISEGTVKSRLSRSKAKLKIMMEGN